MYLPIFLPWAKQHTSSAPPSPQRCEERPGVKCKRRNAVVQNVPTTSVSRSLSPSLYALGFLQKLFLMSVSSFFLFHFSPPPSLPLRWAGCCRLQVRGTPQPMKNDCRRAPWLWWTSPYVGLSLFSIWLPPEKMPRYTHTRTHTHTNTHTHTHTCIARTHKSGKRSGPNIYLVEGRGCARVNTRSRGPFCLCVHACVCVCVLT